MPQTRRLQPRPRHQLPRRLARVYQALERGPQTVAELAQALGMTGPHALGTVRSYLSQLARVTPVLVDFSYGESRYRLENGPEKKDPSSPS